MTSPLADPGHEARVWWRLSVGYGLLAATLMGYFVMRVPIQVYDCFTDMCALLRPMSQLLAESFTLQAYLRPGRWVLQKGLFELSGGHYFLAFRTFQAMQVMAVVLLFVALLRPRRALDAAVVPLALAVLLGSHTFAWTVLEAFPVNHFLTILLCCAAAANLAFSTHRWWTDVLAVVVFVVASATIETGLLVWVIFAAGYIVGLRGVSRTGLVVLSLLLGVYFVIRFVVLDLGVPELVLREGGFGFRRYTGEELQAIFAGRPFVFYAYNVAASFLGVLLSEPRHGVWTLTAGLAKGEPDPALVVNVLSSVLATGLIGYFMWMRRRHWLSGALERDDRIVLLFWVVLTANSVISYAYTKDAIISPAGFFFAAAVFVAVRHLLAALSDRSRPAIVVACLVFLTVSSTWAVRWVGIHAALDATAAKYRQQWAGIDELLPRMRSTLTPDERAIRDTLQDEAVRQFPMKPVLRDEWTGLFDID